MEKIDKFIAFEYIIGAIIVISTLLLKTNIASAGFMLSFLILIVYFAWCIFYDKQQKFEFVEILTIIVLSMVCLLINSIFFSQQINFDYFKEYIIFQSTIIYLYIILNSKINHMTANFILKFNVLFAFIYPIAYNFFPQKNLFRELCLNFTNPNLAAMWILQSVLYAGLALIILKSKIWKLASIISIVYNIFLINETVSRNAIIAVVVFSALIVFCRIKPNPHFSNGLLLFFVVFPFVFVFLYLFFIDNIVAGGHFDFLVSEGKTLSSRVIVWTSTLEKMGKYWLIGNYAENSGNNHNALLNIFGAYGAIVLIVVFKYIYDIIKFINKNVKDRKGIYCIAAFLAVLFMGIGEGALFSGGQGIFIFACGFLILAKAYFSDDEYAKLKEKTQ